MKWFMPASTQTRRSSLKAMAVSASIGGASQRHAAQVKVPAAHTSELTSAREQVAGTPQCVISLLHRGDVNEQDHSPRSRGRAEDQRGKHALNLGRNSGPAP
jgi:hypothetical protein